MTARLASLALILTFAASCSVYIGPPTEWKARKIPKPEGELTPAIVSASSLVFSSERNPALAGIAANPKLAPAEQEYLLAVLKKLGGFSSGTTEVLVALANNPASTAATRAKVAEVASSLSLFSSDKMKVTEALADR